MHFSDISKEKEKNDWKKKISVCRHGKIFFSGLGTEKLTGKKNVPCLDQKKKISAPRRRKFFFQSFFHFGQKWIIRKIRKSKTCYIEMSDKMRKMSFFWNFYNHSNQTFKGKQEWIF